MLKIVRDLSSRHLYGVVSDKPTWRVVIPVIYEQIIQHKFGFSCKLPNNDTWEAYTVDGIPVLRNCKNVLFLANDYLLFGAPNDKCYIMNIKSRTAIANMAFDAVLVFIGDSNEATEFDSKTDVFDLVLRTTYSLEGAHIESSLCAKSNGLWGIIDVNSNTITTDFTHSKLIQKSGNRITVIG